MTNELIDLIKTRRSVRSYKADPVPQELLDTVLEAGTYAPTGGGHQSPVIVAVTNPETRERLRALNGGLQIECTDTVYPPLPAGGDDEMYDRAVSSDLPVRAAKAAVRAAEQGVKVSRQGWIPKLEVGYRRNTEGPDAVHGFLVGGSIPLFANKNKVKSAKARHAEAQLQQAEAGIKAENDARALVEEMRLLRDAAKTFDVPLMRQTLALLDKAVGDGEMSVTDFYTEADYVYRNLLAYMAIERKYHGIIADLCKNDL